MKFKLFASCIPVKGAIRSLICDLQRNEIKFIPNELFEILVNHSNKTLDEIKRYYGNKFDDTIDEYFEFLIENEYGFWCKNPSLFPSLDLTWESPFEITNSLIDYNENSKYDFSKIFSELESLGCKNIQLRFYSEISIKKLYNILEHTNKSIFSSIELVIKYSTSINIEKLNELSDRFLRINSIIVHSAPESRIVKEYGKDFEVNSNILYVKEIIDSDLHCGIITPKYFSINTNTFFESQKHNTCLNRKISIDINGNIKNCPSMNKSYGNINNTTLREVINKDGFKDFWTICKDKIDVCKDCEFRHVCTDCRAFIKDSNNIYSQPAKCTYNPYIAKWLHQDEWISVEEWREKNFNINYDYSINI